MYSLCQLNKSIQEKAVILSQFNLSDSLHLTLTACAYVCARACVCVWREIPTHCSCTLK